MATRADLISELKRRGIKGRLSKMKKHELEDLVNKSKPEQKLSVDEGPTEKKKSHSAYHTFVRENIKKHGGDMKAVAAAYRAQKGGGETKEDVEGGHFVTEDNKISGRQNAKYPNHSHNKAKVTDGTHRQADVEKMQGGSIMKKLGKHATKAAINVGKGAVEAVGEALLGKGDGAHAEFMDATHSYCDAQQGGGDTDTDDDEDEDVSHYMKGGAYWSDDGKKKP